MMPVPLSPPSLLLLLLLLPVLLVRLPLALRLLLLLPPPPPPPLSPGAAAILLAAVADRLRRVRYRWRTPTAVVASPDVWWKRLVAMDTPGCAAIGRPPPYRFRSVRFRCPRFHKDSGHLTVNALGRGKQRRERRLEQRVCFECMNRGEPRAQSVSNAHEFPDFLIDHRSNSPAVGGATLSVFRRQQQF